jgi:hypothetical protein
MARGYHAQGDIITQTADGRSLNDIWAELAATMEMWNAPRTTLQNFLTFPVTQPIEEVPQITGEDFEKASEFGVPKSIRGGAYFNLAYTFDWYDIAERYTWMFLAESSAQQVQNTHNMVFEADNRLIFNAVMKTVFNNVNLLANIRNQSYNVYKFYNADGTIPPPYKNNTFNGTHTHYLSSGGATVDGQDLVDMEDHLVHHGYSKNNGSSLFLLINRAQSATVRTFRVATGSPYDFIPAQGQPPFLLPTNTGGIAPPIQAANSIAGLNVIGTYGNWLVIEEDYIPAGYMFGFATGGIFQLGNPIGLREHQNAALRGLRLVKGPNQDYPLIDAYYNRGFGTGVRQRGGGVVMQVTAGAYSIPTAYV